MSALAQRIFRFAFVRLGGNAAPVEDFTLPLSILSPTTLAASRIFCLGVKTIFGVLRASSTVTSSGCPHFEINDEMEAAKLDKVYTHTHFESISVLFP